MPHINQALVFIKPHVADRPDVLERIAGILSSAGVATVARRTWTAAELGAAGIIDRHYSANARAGTCADPAQLAVGADARRLFAETFGLSWDDAIAAGRVVSGLEAQHRLHLDAEALNARWSCGHAQKIAGGLYVALFTPENLFVLNGFYPSIREVFAAPHAVVQTQLVELDPARLPWRRFRDDIIGVTNPAAAAAGSIRGQLCAAQKTLKIQVNYRENVIHASASAFEAFCEKELWMPGRDVTLDPLWQALAGRGPARERLRAWRGQNPLVTLDGRTATLLDLLENLDTDPTAAALVRLDKLL